jgi:hypothetical protein
LTGVAADANNYVLPLLTTRLTGILLLLKLDNGMEAQALVAATGRTSLGLGSLAVLSTTAAQITANTIGAASLNVAGNGTAVQF